MNLSDVRTPEDLQKTEYSAEQRRADLYNRVREIGSTILPAPNNLSYLNL